MNVWPEETKVPLDSVYLFEKNPRHSELQNQEEVIERLCEHERIYELAQSISEHGLNPLNVPGVVERDPKKRKLRGHAVLRSGKETVDSVRSSFSAILKKHPLDFGQSLRHLPTMPSIRFPHAFR